MSLFPYAERRWEPRTTPSLVMSSGPDRVVRDQPAAEGEAPAHPVGFTPPAKRSERPPTCVAAGCSGKRCAGGAHRPKDARELVRAAETQTTEARLHTR